jgi:hypothetical protein
MHNLTQIVRRWSDLRPILAAALVLTLAGCFVSDSRKEEADAKAQAAYARCDELHRAGRYKTYAGAAECAVPTVVAAYEESGYPFTDLIALSIQARRIGARRIDSGDVTEDEYRRDLAELDSRIAAEEARRRGIMTHGGNPKMVSLDPLIVGLRSFTPEPSAAQLPALRAGNCVPLGEIKSCK